MLHKNIPSSFDDFYVSNNNWMTEIDKESVNAILTGMYPDFYVNSKPDTEKIKLGIMNNDAKAKELFKCLFPLAYVQTAKSITEVTSIPLKHISQQFGKNIVAHGVEEMKGGMYNLLMIAISDCVRVPAMYWGELVPGMANISPLAHGPYYIIFTTKAKEMKLPPNYPALSDIEHILLPFEKNITILQSMAEDIMKANMLAKEQKDLFCSKLIDYQSFLSLLSLNAPKIKKQSRETNENVSPVSKKPRINSQENHSTIEQPIVQTEQTNISPLKAIKNTPDKTTAKNKTSPGQHPFFNLSPKPDSLLKSNENTKIKPEKKSVVRKLF